MEAIVISAGMMLASSGCFKGTDATLSVVTLITWYCLSGLFSEVEI